MGRPVVTELIMAFPSLLKETLSNRDKLNVWKSFNRTVYSFPGFPILNVNGMFDAFSNSNNLASSFFCYFKIPGRTPLF